MTSIIEITILNYQNQNLNQFFKYFLKKNCHKLYVTLESERSINDIFPNISSTIYYSFFFQFY